MQTFHSCMHGARAEGHRMGNSPTGGVSRLHLSCRPGESDSVSGQKPLYAARKQSTSTGGLSRGYGARPLWAQTEAVGTVTAVGSAVQKLAVGDRVLVSCITSWGSCGGEGGGEGWTANAGPVIAGARLQRGGFEVWSRRGPSLTPPWRFPGVVTLLSHEYSGWRYRSVGERIQRG